MDLSEANVAVFADHLGSRFRVVTGNGQIAEIELIAAEIYRSDLPRQEEGRKLDREPFSLLFEVLVPELSIRQRLYQIEHAALGNFELFLTPTGPGRLEAVFN